MQVFFSLPLFRIEGEGLARDSRTPFRTLLFERDRAEWGILDSLELAVQKDSLLKDLDFRHPILRSDSFDLERL